MEANKPNNRFIENFNLLKRYDEALIPSANPIAAALFGLVLVFILYQIVGSLLTLAVFGFDLKNVDKNSLRLMTIAGQLLFILLPALILAKSVYGDVSTIIRFRRLPERTEFLFAVGGLIILTPLFQLFLEIQNYTITKLAEQFDLINSVKVFLDNLDKLVESSYLDILVSTSPIETVLVVIVVTVVPALCEETFFRGFIQKSFELKLKPVWAISITSLFFAMYHFNPYGTIPLFLLSAYLGYWAYKSQSIFIPMTIHFLNNFFAVSMYLIYGEEELISTPDISQINIFSALGQFAFLFVLFIILIFYVNKYYNKLTAKYDLP